MKIRFFFVCLVICVLSCTNINEKKIEDVTQKTGDKTQRIYIKFNSDKIKLSEFFKKVELIKLNGAFVGSIKKLQIVNNNIIFLTGSGNRRVHIYDIETNKMSSIAEMGNGPTQFTSIRDMYTFNSSIYILDFYKRDLFEYKLNGDFKEIMTLPDYCDNIYHLNDSSITLFKKVTYSSDEEYKINSYSIEKNKFNLRNKSLRIRDIEDERDFAQLSTLYSINDTICLTQAFSDTIYNIYVDHISPRYIFDFGQKTLPYDLYYNEKLGLGEFVSKCKESGRVWNINCVMESNDRLFFVYRYYDKIYANIYNKNDNKNKTFRLFDDDIFLQISSMEMTEGFKPIFLDDTALYFLVEPYYLKDKLNSLESNNYLDSSLIKKGNHPFYELANDVNLEDNPILLKYIFN